MYVPEFLLFAKSDIKAVNIFEYVIDYSKFIFGNKLFVFFIPNLIFLFFIKVYLKVNKKEILYEKYKKGEHEILLSFIRKKDNEKQKPTFKSIIRTKSFIYASSFLFMFLLFVIFQVNAFNLALKTKVYSGNETMKPHVAGYISYPITILYQNDEMKKRDFDIETIKKFDRNPENPNRVDDFGSPIGIEKLSNITGYNNLEELKTIFKDKNIYLIQIETFMQLMLAEDKNNIFHDYIKDILKDFFAIYDQSYRFSNFYDLIGIGTSSDATYSVMTGTIPPGALINSLRQTDEVYNAPFALPSLLKNNGYDTLAVVGSHPIFYNDCKVFTELYGINKYYFLTDDEKYLTDKYNKVTIPGYMEKEIANLLFHDMVYDYKDILPKNYKEEPVLPKLSDYDNLRLRYHDNHWALDDRMLFHILGEGFEKYSGKHFMFTESKYPHVPYNFIREEDKAFGYRYKPVLENGKVNIEEEILYPELEKVARTLDDNDYKMSQFLGYINRYFKSFKENLLPYRENDSIFIFYGDHGNQSFSKKSYDALFGGVEQDYYKYRSDMKKVISFIYIPDNTKEKVNGVYPGKIVGEQKLLRSQKDIYGTLLEMLDIKNPTHTLYNNLFTTTKGIAICPKHFLVFGDEFVISNKIKNDKIYWFNGEEIPEIKSKISKISDYQRDIKVAFEQMGLAADYTLLLR